MSAEGTIAADLAAIAAKVGAVSKDRNADAGAGGSYKFRGIDDVMNAVHPAFAEHGVTIVMEDVDVTFDVIERGKQAAKWRHWLVTTRFRFVAKDGSELACTVTSEALDNQDKGLGKAHSYGLKDALCRLLTLPTDEPQADNESANIPDATRRRMLSAAEGKKRLLRAVGGDRERAKALWRWPDGADVPVEDLADLIASADSDPFDDDPDPDGPGTTSASAEGEQTTKEASGASDSVADLDERSPAPTEGALGSPTAGEGDEASTATPAEEPAPAEGDIDAATRRRLFALVTECCPAAENLSSEANDEVRKRWLLRLVQALDATAVPLESRSLISERSARKAVLACEEITEGRASLEDFVEGRVRVHVRANGGLTVQRKRNNNSKEAA